MPQPSEAFIQSMRENRRLQRITQVDLATLVSHELGRTIDGPTITRIEKGQRALQLDEAFAIAKALNRTLRGMLPPELTVEEEVTELERDRAVALADLRRLEITKQEIESSLTAIRSRLQELEGQREES